MGFEATQVTQCLTTEGPLNVYKIKTISSSIAFLFVCIQIGDHFLHSFLLQPRPAPLIVLTHYMYLLVRSEIRQHIPAAVMYGRIL